jgi:two-component system, LytTR family, response regulator
MTLTALIVDDERLLRAELRALLSAHPVIHVVAEAATVDAATSALADAPIDVVFLDIQLGSRSGFEVLAAIGAATRIVFVTAFDAYAVRAFEVNALDYLLKPVHPDRLAASVARLQAPPPRPPGTPRLTPESVVFLDSASSSDFARVSAIACVLADGDYTRVVTTDGRERLVLRSLAEWEQRLPVETFARIHRSAIANVGLVAQTTRGRDGRWRLHLPPLARPLVVSRRYARWLRHSRSW